MIHTLAVEFNKPKDALGSIPVLIYLGVQINLLGQLQHVRPDGDPITRKGCEIEVRVIEVFLRERRRFFLQVVHALPVLCGPGYLEMVYDESTQMAASMENRINQRFLRCVVGHLVRSPVFEALES
jgi:hypothetical protein